MIFFVWFDDTPKKPTMDKLQEAMAAAVARFTVLPQLVLVNAADQLELIDIIVRCTHTVQPNTFWLGYAEPVMPTDP